MLGIVWENLECWKILGGGGGEFRVLGDFLGKNHGAPDRTNRRLIGDCSIYRRAKVLFLSGRHYKST